MYKHLKKKTAKNIFTWKGGKLSLQCRILPNEELHNEHTSPSTAVAAAITEKT